jgi:hypothetical protein
MSEIVTTVKITEHSETSGFSRHYEMSGPEDRLSGPVDLIAGVLDAYSVGADPAMGTLLLQIAKHSQSDATYGFLRGLAHAYDMWNGAGTDFEDCIKITVDAAKLLGHDPVESGDHRHVHMMRIYGIEVVNMPGDLADMPKDIHA